MSAFMILGAVVVLFGLFQIWTTFFSKKVMHGIVSIPGGLPFFGHVFTLLKGSPWDTMAAWVLQYGAIFNVQIFGSNMICVADPEILRVILQTKLNKFQKDLEWTYKPFMVLLGNGLVTSHGPNWWRQRRLLSVHLKSGILEEIPPMALKAVQRLVHKLRQNNGKTLEMAEEFRHLTLQVIAEAVCSLSPEESDVTFARMYLPIVEEGNLRTWQPHRMYLPTPSWFKFRHDVRKLNNYVVGLIRARWHLRAEEKANMKGTDRKQDLLDKLLSSLTEEEWNEEMINQFRDEMKTFVLAGHETSASMLTWSLYELSLPTARSKELMERVLQEARVVFKDHMDAKGNITSIPTLDELMGLKFTECCLRESLRKYSNVPTVVRVATEDVEIESKNLTIPKGATLMISMQGVHHNPKYWSDPLEYKPERFLEEIQPYTFLPFIEGPRMCLGQYLALLESKIVLSFLLMQRTFEIQNLEDAGKKHQYMIPIIPAHGHHMTSADRKK